MVRRVYHVIRNGRDGWKGVMENSGHAPVTGIHKQDVIKRTVAMAKCHSRCSVIIHKADGSIQEEQNFPRSASKS
ncbi:DUF2188 domain-containing protein [Flavobacterium sp. NRK1]|uniref:DUF2188 domain-containing protein n=1 Tax=Flavobacterium sp. NRK1 TaxID=2954929 RepID=UPI00209338B0|nr:DUF2188 domain-containing protein [Flavobacterium sp. NRK1]MCO6146734.1 DUF2188 domain-containing protein [Flavobacterium sp. NRK1]